MSQIFTLLFLALTLALPGKAEAGKPVAEKHAHVRLISPVTSVDTRTMVPAALHITLDEGWKTYWRTPGEAGLAPSFDWRGSQNLEHALVKWPVPHRFTIYDIDNYGYKNEVIFPLELRLSAIGHPLVAKLKLDILVCTEICVPETHHVTLEMPAGESRTSADKDLYDKAEKHLPFGESKRFRFKTAYLNYDSSNRNFLVVEAETRAAPAADADLFVEHGSGASFGAPEISYDAAAGIVRIVAPVESVDPLDKLEGALFATPMTMTYVSGDLAVEGTVLLSARPAEIVPLSQEGDFLSRIDRVALRIVLFAFLGGLILNLMPCVLPVLSLKVLKVLSYSGKANRRTIFRNFTASAAGILCSFWLIALLLSALKAAGVTIGWGIQFQHPAFLVFLIVVVLAFAANMWGAYEIPLPRFIIRAVPARLQDEPTLLGHFMTGAFAALMATPCTAPFLGTAISFALAQDAANIFAIFTMVGLGLAFPYLVLAVSPGAFRFMPRPGKWMMHLRKFLALALVLTAVWLGNVLLTIMTTPALDSGWWPFEEHRIAEEVAAGKVVFVDVTAEWCLTCKANKRIVLDSAEIEEALSGPEIVKMQADWTHRDEAILDFLQKNGRYGIPFDIVYGPAVPTGIVLPELLSKKAVLSAISEAAGE